MKERKLMVMEDIEHATWSVDSPRWVWRVVTWRALNSHKIRPKLEHTNLTQFVQSFPSISNFNMKIHEGTLLIGMGALENKMSKGRMVNVWGAAFRVWLSQNRTLGLFF